MFRSSSISNLQSGRAGAYSSAAMTISLLSIGISMAIAMPFRSIAAVTFQPTNIIKGEGQDADAEAPDIAATEENVYIIWHMFPPDAGTANRQPDVYVSRSGDRGRTFRKPQNLSNSKEPTSDEEQIAVSGSNVYVVWRERKFDAMGATIADDILFRRSTDRGATFAGAKKLNGTVKPNFDLQIAASGKHVYVVWTSIGPSGFEDAFIVGSSDRGHSFDDPQNVSNNEKESLDAEVAATSDKVIVGWRDFTVPGVDRFKYSLDVVNYRW